MSFYDVTRFIPDGKENAIPMKMLATAMNVDLRTARLKVEQARRNGAPICSVCNSIHGGYYIPKTKNEAQAYIRMQKHRIRSARAALMPVQKALNNLPE